MITAKIPNKVTILLTHRCNQSCEFCFDASNVLSASPSKDIPLETVDNIISSLRESVEDVSAFNVTLSGGEPTLHPRFLEIVERISNAGFTITILSNGQRFADKSFMDEVLRFNIWNFQFSIEGATADTHDSRVGCRGAWEKTVRAIQNAKEGGARFITNSTMTWSSVDEMFRLIDFLDDLGVPKMNIGNTLPECAGRNWSVMMQYPEVVEIAEQLTLYALTKRIAFSFITPLPLCLKNGSIINNPSVCSAGRYSVTIDTDGTIQPCSVCNPKDFSLPRLQDLKSYNEAHSRLDEIVERYVKSDIPHECRTCEQLAECKACCPLYWKAAGVATPSEWRSQS